MEDTEEFTKDRFLEIRKEDLRALIPDAVITFFRTWMESSMLLGFEGCVVTEIDLSGFSRNHDKDCSISERLELNNIRGIVFTPKKKLFFERNCS